MKEYTVVINGVEHTMQLDDDDAKAYGEREGVEVKAATPQNKSRSTATK